MKICENFAKSHNIVFNLSKTKLLCYNKDPYTVIPPIYLNGEQVRPAPMSVYNGILRSYFLLGTKISFASNNDEKFVDRFICFHAITSRRRKWISASCSCQQNLA